MADAAILLLAAIAEAWVKVPDASSRGDLRPTEIADKLFEDVERVDSVV